MVWNSLQILFLIHIKQSVQQSVAIFIAKCSYIVHSNISVYHCKTTFTLNLIDVD